MEEAPPSAGRKRLAVVLGTGGIQCAAALGLANVLAREGIAIDLLVGSDGGSLFAAVMALGLPSRHAAAWLGKLWCHDLTRQRDERALLHAMLPQSTEPEPTLGVDSHNPVTQLLAEVFGETRIENTAIPLLIKATDTRTGAQAVFSRGRLADVVRASNTRPFTCEPWMLDGRTYADGFWSAPQASGARASAGIVLALHFANPAEETGEPLPAYAALHLGNRLPQPPQPPQSGGEKHAITGLSGEVLAVMPSFNEPIGRFDNSKIAYIMAQGERATIAVLPQLRERLAEIHAPGVRRLSLHPNVASELKRKMATAHD